MGSASRLRERLRYLVLYRPGDDASERAASLLAGVPAIPLASYTTLETMLDGLAALEADALPVAVVCPGIAEPQHAARQLLRAREGLQLALIVPPGDARSLGEHFRNHPVPARQVELIQGVPDGLAARVLAVGRALAQREAHQLAIKRTSERLTSVRLRSLDLTAEPVRRALLHALPLGVVVLNPAGYVVDMNETAGELLALGERAGHGRLSVEHVDTLLPQWDLATSEREALVTSAREGAARQLRVRATPLGDEQAPLGFVLTLEDVTEQEEARRVLRASAAELERRVVQGARKLDELRHEQESIRNFVVTLTHDLRSPLAAASMQLELLRRRAEAEGDAWAKEGLERVGQGIQRINRMAENLLDVARHDAGGKLEISLQPSRLDRLLLEVVEDLRRVHARDYEVDSPLPPVTGLWDPDGMRRIIENLGNNAAKYGDPLRPITVWLLDKGDSVLLRIRNFGATIPPDMQRSLFQPFYRAATGDARAAPGWGLGLAFVRAMAEAHGGTVAVASSARTGTVFTVELPKHPPEFAVRSASNSLTRAS